MDKMIPQSMLNVRFKTTMCRFWSVVSANVRTRRHVQWQIDATLLTVTQS